MRYQSETREKPNWNTLEIQVKHTKNQSETHDKSNGNTYDQSEAHKKPKWNQ